VPLIWVAPLGLYLLTFIVAFGRWPAWAHTAVVRVAPVAAWTDDFSNLK
jgi:hypothetical protein